MRAAWLPKDDGTVHAYTHGITAVNDGYNGGTYDPIRDRIYFTPYEQADEADWHYLQIFGAADVSRQLAAHACFDKL